MYDIPILFIIFNRKEIALTSFDKIKKIQPRKIYIASDGPRDFVLDEFDVVNNVRQTILEQIDWNCEIKTLFQKKNLGCSLGVYSAITWLFENEEFGIILEDDCIVSNSFFSYMEYLLKKYKDENRVGMIAGHNQLGVYKSSYSYIFSKYKACWGWATWKRAWENMDLRMLWRETENKDSVLLNMGYKGKDYRYWKYRLHLIDIHAVSAWDWQWYFSLAKNNQLCIFPQKNLVSNVGFGKNATHTSLFGKTIEYHEFETNVIENNYIMPDFEFDKKFYKKNNNWYNYINQMIPVLLKKRIKKFLESFMR